LYGYNGWYSTGVANDNPRTYILASALSVSPSTWYEFSAVYWSDSNILDDVYLQFNDAGWPESSYYIQPFSTQSQAMDGNYSVTSVWTTYGTIWFCTGTFKTNPSTTTLQSVFFDNDNAGVVNFIGGVRFATSSQTSTLGAMPAGQGVDGGPGATGATGAPGLSGVQGPQGPQGPAGPQGLQGTQGPQGPQGVNGNGSPGAQGAQGPQGFAGAQGPQGTIGRGLTGVPGAQGAQGVQGPQGPTGVQGPFGPSPTGQPGTQGPQAASQYSAFSVAGLSINTGVTTPAGQITASGDIVSSFSDERLKKNIRNIENCLEIVQNISGIVYTNNKLAQRYGFQDSAKQVGLIAQQIKPFAPEVVSPAPFDIDIDGGSKSGNHYLTVSYEKLIPILVEAIKEQQAQLKVLLEKIKNRRKEL
jgi:hypothetical protein